MGLAPFSWPSDEPVICRECVRCGAVLDVTPEDQLVCARCGRVKAWTVSVNGQLMGAGLERPRRGFCIWLRGELADLLPASLSGSTASGSGWNEDVDTGEWDRPRRHASKTRRG